MQADSSMSLRLLRRKQHKAVCPLSSSKRRDPARRAPSWARPQTLSSRIREARRTRRSLLHSVCRCAAAGWPGSLTQPVIVVIRETRGMRASPRPQIAAAVLTLNTSAPRRSQFAARYFASRYRLNQLFFRSLADISFSEAVRAVRICGGRQAHDFDCIRLVRFDGDYPDLDPRRFQNKAKPVDDPLRGFQHQAVIRRQIGVRTPRPLRITTSACFPSESRA